MLVAFSLASRADDEAQAAPAPATDDSGSSSDSSPSNAGLHDALQQEDLNIHHAKRRPLAQPQNTAPVVTIDGDAPPDTVPVDTTKHIQLFLIPLGDDTAPLLPAVQSAIEAEVNNVKGFEPLDLVEALEPPPPPDVAGKMNEARHALQDGNQLLQAQQFVDAAGRYQHAVDLFTATAAASLSGCSIPARTILRGKPSGQPRSTTSGTESTGRRSIRSWASGSTEHAASWPGLLSGRFPS
jgi:hypothetical protein